MVLCEGGQSSAYKNTASAPYSLSTLRTNSKHHHRSGRNSNRHNRTARHCVPARHHQRFYDRHFSLSLARSQRKKKLNVYRRPALLRSLTLAVRSLRARREIITLFSGHSVSRGGCALGMQMKTNHNWCTGKLPVNQ